LNIVIYGGSDPTSAGSQQTVLKIGLHPSKSCVYMLYARPICLRLLVQETCLALDLAMPSAGRSMAARIAMIARDKSNSITVK
jgi:hypothetical protein